MVLFRDLRVFTLKLRVYNVLFRDYTLPNEELWTLWTRIRLIRFFNYFSRFEKHDFLLYFNVAACFFSVSDLKVWKKIHQLDRKKIPKMFVLLYYFYNRKLKKKSMTHNKSYTRDGPRKKLLSSNLLTESKSV